MGSIMRVFQENRGPVFIEMNHLNARKVEEIKQIIFSTERPIQKKFFAGRGINFREDPIELHPTEFFLCGGHGLTGLIINERAETSLPGLFAAGDVACVPGQHLTGAFVFGEIAAEGAVSLATCEGMPKVDEAQISAERKRVFAPLGWSGGKITPQEFERKVRGKITDYLVPPKNETKLKIGLEWMDRLSHEMSSVLLVDDYHQLGRVLEISCIIDCARLSALASLARRESRWGLYHHRIDYPQTDDENWCKHVILRKNGEGCEISFKPVKEKPYGGKCRC